MLSNSDICLTRQSLHRNRNSSKSAFPMARSNILARLSSRRRERRASTSNGDVNQAPQNTSWRRQSLASLGRRLSPGLRPALPSPTTDSDVLHIQSTSAPNDKGVELPATYSKPVELIRQEEYPHMNQGNPKLRSFLPLTQHLSINQRN